MISVVSVAGTSTSVVPDISERRRAKAIEKVTLTASCASRRAAASGLAPKAMLCSLERDGPPIRRSLYALKRPHHAVDASDASQTKPPYGKESSLIGARYLWRRKTSEKTSSTRKTAGSAT